MSEKIAEKYLVDMRHQLRSLKSLADNALLQVKDDEFPIEIDEESNSITILMKHIAGNMKTLWTCPLAPVNDWPVRYRDLEFTLTEDDTRKMVTEKWTKAWEALFNTLDELKVEDLLKPMTIRGEDTPLIVVINSQYRHYAVHVGQIIFLAKHFRSKNWNSLSIPKKR